MKNQIVILVLLFLALCGCSQHENPLAAKGEAKAATFLILASRQAAQEIEFTKEPGDYLYGACMNGKYDTALCTKAYNSMLVYAQRSRDFGKLTLQELQDKNAWQLLEPEYRRQLFNMVVD